MNEWGHIIIVNGIFITNQTGYADVCASGWQSTTMMPSLGLNRRVNVVSGRGAIPMFHVYMTEKAEIFATLFTELGRAIWSLELFLAGRTPT